MTQFGACPLVCLFSIWPGQGFYVEIFLIDAFPCLQQWKWKKVFSWCFQCKDVTLAALLHNFREHKNVNQFIHFQIHPFYLNLLCGERRGFPWPLVVHIGLLGIDFISFLWLVAQQGQALPHVIKKCEIYPTTIIIGDLWNTKLDTIWLSWGNLQSPESILTNDTSVDKGGPSPWAWT